jgi:LmbE family N-acetylglucosaminyl deacetylase
MPLMTPSGTKTLSHHLRVIIALLLVVLVACATPPPQPPAPPGQAGRGPVFAQVVAHQDDDILFMNPDLQNSLRAGVPSVTVFLTAGESNDPNPAAYIAGRQAGAKAAYAKMLRVPDTWHAEPLTIAGVTVELYRLAERPEIQLIFVNLPENANPQYKGGPGALTRMWRDADVRERTLVPSGGVVSQPSELDHAGLVRLLVDLFARFRPTTIRTQDAQPDRRYSAGWAPLRDHPDHVMAARFTGEAARVYRTRGASPRAILVNFRDYNIEEAPVNLGEAQQQEKLETFAEYGKHDPKVFYTGSYDAWPRRQYYRWPLGTTWATLDADNRVQAFLVQGGELLTWWQEADGTWGGPMGLGDAGGMLAPSVSVARGGDGRLHVFARRVDEDRIVTLVQGAAGSPKSWPAGWQNLGNPNQNGGAGATPEFGVPVAAAGPDGKLTVFVRNAAGAVSRRTEETVGGAWERDWTNLEGTDVQDGIAALSHAHGIGLYGWSRGRVVEWRNGEDGPFTFDDKYPYPPPAGPPVLCPAEGGLAVLVKRAGTAEVSLPGTAYPGATGPGGFAAICEISKGLAVRMDVTVFARNPAGAVIMYRNGSWTELPGADLVDQPIAIRDGAGRILLLGEGTNGRLLVNQGLTGWQAVGS